MSPLGGKSKLDRGWRTLERILASERLSIPDSRNSSRVRNGVSGKPLEWAGARRSWNYLLSSASLSLTRFVACGRLLDCATDKPYFSFSPNSVKQLLFFSADRTQPFLTALSNYEDSTTVSLSLRTFEARADLCVQLGMISSSTPFHTSTGAPFSLFKDGESYSTGAVGIAIIENAEKVVSTETREVKVDYAGMAVFGESMQVTASVLSFLLLALQRTEFVIVEQRVISS